MNDAERKKIESDLNFMATEDEEEEEGGFYSKRVKEKHIIRSSNASFIESD